VTYPDKKFFTELEKYAEDFQSILKQREGDTDSILLILGGDDDAGVNINWEGYILDKDSYTKIN
jgi:hypothetical protein